MGGPTNADAVDLQIPADWRDATLLTFVGPPTDHGQASLVVGRDALTEGKVGKEVKDQAINIPSVMSEPRHYGMHRHFTAAGSILMFGGGIKQGFVYGKTADERPCTTIENPVIMENLHATMYHALGIAPDTSYVVERRPVYVTRDGKGEPILELFA